MINQVKYFKLLVAFLFYFFFSNINCKAQPKIEAGAGFQLKRGVIYNINQISNAPNRYVYSTGILNFQYDLTLNWRYKHQWSFYSGISIGYSSHKCGFKYNTNSNYTSQTYKVTSRSIKVPIKVGYMLGKRFEVLIGLSPNFSTVARVGVAYEFGIGNSNNSKSKFQAPPVNFTTGSILFGIQYHTKKRTSWFTQLDYDLGKYPTTILTNTIIGRSGQQDITYNTSYKPQLCMISIGMYIRIWGSKKQL
jgi:hypothetical protein